MTNGAGPGMDSDAEGAGEGEGGAFFSSRPNSQSAITSNPIGTPQELATPPTLLHKRLAPLGEVPSGTEDAGTNEP